MAIKMEITKLDKNDMEILRALQHNARQSMRLLSKRIDVPITTLHRRIKRLEKAKVIKKYIAVVDGKAVGKEVTAFMLANVALRMDVDKIAANIAKIPGMQEVHYTTGEWDIIMKVKVPTLNDYYNFSAKTALQIPGIGRTMGIITPRTFKEEFTLDI